VNIQGNQLLLLLLTLSAALAGHCVGSSEMAWAKVLVFCDWGNLQPAQGQQRQLYTSALQRSSPGPVLARIYLCS